MRSSKRIEDEHGAVLIVFAILFPVLMILTAGGVAGYNLYASQRELQRAADQSALAGAAALPPFDPNVLVEESPFPLPQTDDAWAELPIDPPEDVPELAKMRDIVPDPRAVSCRLGSALLTSEAATIVSAFGVSADDDDEESPETVCEDYRVIPRMQSSPEATTAWECTNALARKAASSIDIDDDPFDPLAGLDLGDPDPGSLQDTVNDIVEMPLDRVLPAALTPQMRVDTLSGVHPPFLSFITGEGGLTLRTAAVAHRRIKNAVVVPILPDQMVRIRGDASLPGIELETAVEVMTDPVNLNRALDTDQAPLINAIDELDEELTDLMGTYGLPCDHLLHNMRRDLRDIYDPPAGPAPAAADIVDDAIASAERTAARLGEIAPDPDNPDSLAGEAFVLIGVSVDESMELISDLQVPILDVALVTMHRTNECDDIEAATECYEAALVSAANAHGAFRATLVR